jgi:hypothetical protein
VAVVAALLLLHIILDYRIITLLAIMSDFYNEQEDFLEDLVEVPDDESLGIAIDTEENDEMMEEERNEDNEENDNAIHEVNDNSFSFFNGHNDSVYCAAVHPKYTPRTILTGNSFVP